MTIPFVDIAIIGGGPGGLSLAQGLRKNGIETAVFERDVVHADYVQGFRLRIRQRGLDVLALNLPPLLYETFKATIGTAPAETRAFDERFRPVADAGSPYDREDTHVEKSVSRITLRQILLSGLDDIVHTGRTFTAYEPQDDGTVIARFADGSAVRTNLLVGADGAGSTVRRQFLPHLRSVDTGMRRLAGKITLAEAARHAVPSDLLNYNANIRPRAGRRMMISSHRVDPAPYAHFGLIGQDDPTHRAIAGSHFNNVTSYAWWNTAYGADELAPDPVLLSLDGAGLLALLVVHIRHWDERLLHFIRNTDPSTVALLKVRTSEPGATWMPGPVTLLGDAIHAMTYFKALGGNTALHDSGLLVRELVASRREGKPFLAAIGDYETAMRDHGYAAVRDSLSAMSRNAAASAPPESTVLAAE